VLHQLKVACLGVVLSLAADPGARLLAAVPSGTGTGLKGSYFTNPDLMGLAALVRTDGPVYFEWGQNSPGGSIPVNGFSVRWTGTVEAPVTGAFTFYTKSDDGVRLWIDGKLQVNHWTQHSLALDQGTPINLVAGTKYKVQLEYFDGSGGAIIDFRWSYPGQAQQTVPKQYLYPGDFSPLQEPPPVVSRVWLSDLNWISAVNGSGPPELDLSNGTSAAGDGKPLTIGGQKYNYGLGVRARSEIKYALDDRYDMFRAVIGIDDEVGNAGSAVFEVWTDGVRAYQSPVMKGSMAGVAVAVPVENVRELTLIVTDGGDGSASDNADWADARFEGVETVKYLSDLSWTSSTNGSGPVEKDRANGGAAAGDGARIKLSGLNYPKGLGTHAASEVKYKLSRFYELFSAVIGVDDAAAGPGSVIFEVWTDGVRAYRSPVMKKGDGVRSVSVPVGTVDELTLKVLDNGDGNANDLGDWADAKLLPHGSDGWKAPPTPTGLSATAGTSKVTLKWNAAPTATSYNVYRGTTAGGESTSPIRSGITTLDWVDTSVTNGTKYFYKIRGVNQAGMSGLSNEGSATPTPAPVAPSAPTSLDATATGTLTIKLTWGAGANATSYQVFRGTASGGQSSTPIASNVTSTQYTDSTGLAGGVKYFYKVKGVNTTGVSGFSNEDSAIAAAATTPPATLPAPTGLTTESGDTWIRLSWAAVSGAAKYNVYRGTAAGQVGSTPIATGITTTTFKNTGLTNGVKYFYKVAGVNSAGAVGTLSSEISVTPNPVFAAPAEVSATPGDALVTLNWSAVAGATGYNVYRGTSSGGQSTTPVASNVTATTFANTGLTNGTKYYFKVAALGAGGLVSPMSKEVYAIPIGIPTAPQNLTATGAPTKITLNWTAVAGASSYNVYRGTTSNGQSATPIATGIGGTSFHNSGLTNGTQYFYKVAGVNANNVVGAMSNEASATPMVPPAAPTGLSAVGSDRQVSLTWNAVPDATGYNLYAGPTSGGQAATPVAANLTSPAFVHTGLPNGTEIFYRVAAVNGGGEGSRSAEVSAAPIGAPPVADPATLSAWRLLRQSTWGPRPGDVERVRQIGRTAFLNEQFAAAPSVYPDTLYEQVVEYAQEHMLRLALTGNDQLRQRVAFALHKIWVVSAVEVDNARAIVPYHRILLNGAFGNYRDIMRNITLNPAMGRYLNMLNNRSQTVTGVPPNENYPREILQLFTLGLSLLNPDGTPMLDGQGRQIPTYTEDDVKELARIFTGWTFGDGNPATIPTRNGSENYTVPMEAVASYHDAGAKTFLGESFPAGATAVADLDHALDVIFNHPNIAPFVSRQLIQMLVISNPSPAYVGAIAAVFANNGGGVRGDLTAVVRAILEHPDANLGTATAGKLMEPALFAVSQARSLNAQVVDTPFIADLGQRVFYPGSVCSYFSPGYRIRGTTLAGPEFQILTSVTALARVNFSGRLISGGFGSDVTIDFTPFTSRAGDPAALVDYCSLLFMGGQMSEEHRNEIIGAVRVTAASNPTERVRTALYLTLASAQYQVDR
jgi:fibronectin type 3 domain-containing protein